MVFIGNCLLTCSVFVIKISHISLKILYLKLEFTIKVKISQHIVLLTYDSFKWINYTTPIQSRLLSKHSQCALMYILREGRRLVLGHPGGVVVEALPEAPSEGVKLKYAGVLRVTDEPCPPNGTGG